MSYNSSASVYITNDTGGTANIVLAHAYSDDKPEVGTWNNVPSGGTVGPLVVGFNTGFVHPGGDYWFCGVQVLSGPMAGSNYASEGSADDPKKECMMEKEDNGQKLTFTVSTSVFLMGLLSGACTTEMNVQS